MALNPIVRKTLTCLERELTGAQATMPEGAAGDESDSEDSDSDASEAGGRRGNMRRARGRATRLDDPPAFAGVAVSSFPLDGAAYHEGINQNATIGDNRRRDGRHVEQSMDEESPKASADNAANAVLFPMGEGGRADTEHACSWKHYRRKMLGSIADVYAGAQEFIWYHFQLMVKRSMHQAGGSVVNPHLAMNATRGDVSEHASQLRERWAELKRTAPEYMPYCNVRETFTGTVGANVIGSKAY